jgi:hypothetical protein
MRGYHSTRFFVAMDDGNCSIKQQKITIGQTATGARKGVAIQALKLLPHNCVFGGPTDTTLMTYNAVRNVLA